MGSSELIKKIENDILETGYITEMRVARQCINSGGLVKSSPMYTDKDSTKGREYDVQATFTWSKHESVEKASAHLFLDMCIEVKSSKYPWVLMQNNRKSLPFLGALQAYSDSTPKAWQSLFEGDSWVGTQPTAYGIHQAFKKPNEHQQSYEALLSACKAAHHELDVTIDALFSTGIQKPNQPAERYAPKHYVVRPVVVTDAPLFTTCLLDDGNLATRPTEWGTVDFRFRTPSYNRGLYSVDVVTVNSLSKYLETIKSHFEKKVQALRTRTLD